MYEIDIDCDYDEGTYFLTSPEISNFLICEHDYTKIVDAAQEVIYSFYEIASGVYDLYINEEWAEKFLANPGLQDITCKEDIRVNIRRRDSNR